MRVRKVIDAPAERVWELMVDTECWSDWGPSVKSVRSSERRIQAGSSGRIQTSLGPWVPFRVTDFEPGRRWDWEVGGIAATGHWVEPLGDERCRAVIEVPAWAVPYVWVCRRALEKMAEMV